MEREETVFQSTICDSMEAQDPSPVHPINHQQDLSSHSASLTPNPDARAQLKGALPALVRIVDTLLKTTAMSGEGVLSAVAVLASVDFIDVT